MNIQENKFDFTKFFIIEPISARHKTNDNYENLMSDKNTYLKKLFFLKKIQFKNKTQFF